MVTSSDQSGSIGGLRRADRIVLAGMLLILLGTLLAYSNSLRGVFVLDDWPHIVENPQIRSLWPFAALEDLHPSSRPVMMLTFAWNHAWNSAIFGEGMDARGFHIFNILIHLLAALTLFGLSHRLLRRLSPTERWQASAPWLAVAIALIWVAHPLNTQAVTYLIQRGESLMGLLFLLSLYALVRHAEAEEAMTGRGASSVNADNVDASASVTSPSSTTMPSLWLGLAIAAGVLAMFTKQVAVVLPVVALLMDRAFFAGSLLAAAKKRAPAYGSLLVVAGVVTLVSLLMPVEMIGDDAARGPGVAGGLGGQADATGSPSAGFAMEKYPWHVYAMNQPAVILHYVGLAFAPVGLCFDYDWQPGAGFMQIGLPMTLIALALLVTLVLLWRWPRLGFIPAGFFLILAPTSSILPIADMAVEHRMYLPLMAVVALVVVMVGWVLSRMQHVAAAITGVVMLLIVVAPLIYLTMVRNQDYASAQRLWQDVVAKAPHNARAHHSLGVIALQENDPVQAAQHFTDVIRLRPHSLSARLDLAVALRRQGESQGAENLLRQIIAQKPDYTQALDLLGVVYAWRGEAEQAEHYFRRAMASDPTYADAPMHLGLLYEGQNRLDEAIVYYRRAIELRPADASLHNAIGILYARTDQFDEAFEHFHQATSLEPDNEDYYANYLRILRMNADQP